MRLVNPLFANSKRLFSIEMSKPSIPQGTRDFGPEIVRKRQYILSTLRDVFELYGFQPLETPAMENLETLMGKYGEEGDKLIFKILNNGLDRPEKQQHARNDFEKVLSGKNASGLTERALKYDLTIPFARYVAMNYGQLSMPFKRYQIQPVWRADRPQKGRYREFYQCDADVVGSRSLWNEVEFACLYAEAFRRLKIPDFSLHVNNRKLLRGMMEVTSLVENEKKILVIIDKTDKIGLGGVKEELLQLGIPETNLQQLLDAYEFKGSNQEIIDFLKSGFNGSAVAMEGLEEIEFAVTQAGAAGVNREIHIDLTLARGLEYYTGIIFEAKAPPQVKIGSIGGGGRYDDLTGLFGVADVPGVGISFGLDRIYDVMEELQLFPEEAFNSTKVLFFNLGKEEAQISFGLLHGLRRNGIASEMYHEPAKMDKQFKYAEKRKIPFVVIIGEKELEAGNCSLKDLSSGIQQTLSYQDLLAYQF